MNATSSSSSSSSSTAMIEMANAVWWTVVMPLLALFSALTNGLCIRVLFRLRSQMTVYKHMFAKCVLHLLFALIGSLVFVTKCEPLAHTYAANVYEVYVYAYVARSVVTISTMVEALIALERLMLIKNMNRAALKRNCRLILAGMSVLAFLVHLPVVLFVEIRRGHERVDVEHHYSYYYYHEWSLRTQWSRVIVGVEMSVRGWLMGIVILVLTTLICVSIRKQTRARLNLSQSVSLKRTSSVAESAKAASGSMFLRLPHQLRRSGTHFYLRLSIRNK